MTMLYGSRGHDPSRSDRDDVLVQAAEIIAGRLTFVAVRNMELFQNNRKVVASMRYCIDRELVRLKLSIRRRALSSFLARPISCSTQLIHSLCDDRCTILSSRILDRSTWGLHSDFAERRLSFCRFGPLNLVLFNQDLYISHVPVTSNFCLRDVICGKCRKLNQWESSSSSIPGPLSSSKRMQQSL